MTSLPPLFLLFRWVRKASAALAVAFVLTTSLSSTFPFFSWCGIVLSTAARASGSIPHVRAKVEYLSGAALSGSRAPASGAPGGEGSLATDASGWQKRLISVEPSVSQTGRLLVREFPTQISEHDHRQAWQQRRMVEMLGPESAVLSQLRERGFSVSEIQTFRERGDRLVRNRTSGRARDGRDAQPGRDETRSLVESGPVRNRIDLVFMGDGYTEAEREKFFADVARLTDDLFSGQTFSSYLPLFNVHAVFRPSRVSGIGKGRAVDTAYKLYREGDTLRAIFPGDESAIRESCAAAPDCDYPVVVANDEFYGGLGGEVAITTRSVASGTIVLRHELGHNFGRVGEEYDGGGYFGANSANSLRNLGWKKWLDDPGLSSGADVRALALGWPWKDISSDPYVLRFKSSGERPFASLRLSLSGLAGEGAYEVRLDGKPLEIPVLPNSDRNFVDFDLAEPLSEGSHELRVQALRPSGNPYVSSMTVHEYGFDPSQNPEAIGAFPVFDSDLRVAGYRPTNEACLMRNMLHPWFCPVCQENNWRQLLAPLELVDDYVVRSTSNGEIEVALSVLGVGQFRTKGTPRSPGEALRIRWLVGGREQSAFADQPSLVLPASSRDKKITAELHFVSPEIRNETNNFAQQKLEIDLSRFAL